MNRPSSRHIAAVVPCFRERDHVLDVLHRMGPEINSIIVVDDACPDRTGDFVVSHNNDPRVRVIRNPVNLGVGGATLAGYEVAHEIGASIIVKIDGDGQMDPGFVPELVSPIVNGKADYAKGNRLHRRDAARGMPAIRLFGNMVLTLMSKVSSGYWNIMDPTNGFTAIHASVAAELPVDDIANDFFFESDILSKLAELDAVVCDVPMRAQYGAEQSHLSVRRVFWPFLRGHIRNSVRRLIDTYFIRDIAIASLELVLGSVLFLFGFVFGGINWWLSEATGVPATAGTVVLAALPIIIGVQLILAFIGHDTRRVPTAPIHPHLTIKNNSFDEATR